MTDEQTKQKWRGLRALIHEAVEHGSRAVERVHLDTARRPFEILEQVPGVAGPTKAVHAVHDAVVTTSYAAVRLVNTVVGKATDTALELLAEPGRSPAGADRDPPALDTE